MTSFPIFQHLKVEKYTLYPGTKRNAGLDIDFQPGLTMVLGANGLGKTTLVHLLFRLLSGPYELRNFGDGARIGAQPPELREMTKTEVRLFADRVLDNAADAVATLSFTLGDISFTVSRRLADLSLLDLSIGGEQQAGGETSYQQAVTGAAGVNGFQDWLLILRLVSFYFEDRRALVWDTTAQLQLLQMLFLTPDASQLWGEAYGDVLELDSLVRTLTYVVNKEGKALTETETKIAGVGDIRDQLKTLDAVQAQQSSRLEMLNDQLADTGFARQNGRLTQLRAEQALDVAMRGLERLQLRAIRAAFPSATETGQYILAQLTSEDECLACGTHVPDYAEEIRRRIRSGHCPICGSATHRTSRQPTAAQVRQAAQEATDAQKSLDSARAAQDQTEAAYQELVAEAKELTDAMTAREATIRDLLSRLPKDDESFHERRQGLRSDTARLSVYKERLELARTKFTTIQAETNREIEKRAQKVTESFSKYAKGFLFEDCTLEWTIYRATVGQGGRQVELPSFQLSMTGASFSTPRRRGGPMQVSESQREFIDLSFKMALMDVAGDGHGGTLIIDAPESSLDAVFVSQASNILSRFGSPTTDNRLVVTSNLIDGDLIPELLRTAGIRTARNRRVVDLLELAAPTAAVSARHDQYVKVRDRLFQRATEERA